MARKGNPISVRRDLPVFLFLIYFYILGFNLIITIKLLMDRGIPHILVIGWKGVSLTPPSKRTLFGSFCSNFSLVNSHDFFFFRTEKTMSLKEDENDNYLSAVFLKRILGALTVWHFCLFLIVLWNTYGCPMELNFGALDVRIVPVFER